MSTVILERTVREIQNQPHLQAKRPDTPKILEENPVCLALEDLGAKGIFALIYPQDQQGERYLNQPASAKIYPFRDVTPKTLSERLMKVGACYSISPRQTLELEPNVIILHNYDGNTRAILFDKIPEDLRKYR
ncbi:MAG: hypothetical protein Q7R87_00160 [Nanoarchaeota archaeon]|nr:hypothetical protein [Nanoarchaeota archaeon]